MRRVPHPIPYQGSKRLQAALICAHLPEANRLYEPFAGSAAVSLAAAARGVAKEYVIGEKLEPLASLLREIISNPTSVSAQYAGLWADQFPDPKAHFLAVREKFNRSHDPVALLYLLARCVKNAVRFNPKGQFNQSADHRRSGMHPTKMRENVVGASRLLNGRSVVVCADYRELLDRAGPRDVVYMDPPYQGVSNGRDARYFRQLDVSGFLTDLDRLNSRGVPYILSFDGSCGNREYGEALPAELKLARIAVHTGPSSQATLNGKSAQTVESLYLSPAIAASNVAPAYSLKTRVNQATLSL